MKLSNCIEIISGGTPSTSKSNFWDGDIPWISIKDFNNSFKYIYKTEKSITKQGLEKSSTNMLYKNDIIISARGTVGCLAQIYYPMAFNQSCYGIRTINKDLMQNYLYYWLIANIDKFKKQTHGAVFDTITKSTFDNIEINYPSLVIQQHIVDIIGSIDDKIENNNKIIEKIDKLGLFKYKSLNNEFIEFSKFAEFSKGKEASSQNYMDVKDNTTINFIRVKDLNSITNTYIPKSLNLPIANPNDILISFDGAIGRINYGLNGAYSSGIYKVNPINHNNYGILFWALKDGVNQQIMLEHTNGTTILHGSKSIKYLKIKEHSINDAKFYNNLFDYSLNIKLQNIKLSELKQLYLKKFFG